MTTEAKTDERPLRADAERNRQLILDAAAELIAKRGLSVSMDEIAAHAGVGVGTVYRRFPEREDLFDALFEVKFLELYDLAVEAEAHDDAWEGLKFFIEKGAEVHAHDVGLREVILGSGRGKEKISEARGKMSEPVGKLVARAQAEGKLRPDVVVLDIPVLEMMISSVFDHTGGVHPEHWKRMLEIVLDGLVATRPEPTELVQPPLGIADYEAAMRKRFAGE